MDETSQGGHTVRSQQEIKGLLSRNKHLAAAGLSYFIRQTKNTQFYMSRLCLVFWYHNRVSRVTLVIKKKPTCQCRRHKRHRFNPWVRKIPWRRKWQPIPIFLPGKSHGQRIWAGCRPQGHKKSDTTKETQHTHPGIIIIWPNCLVVVLRFNAFLSLYNEQVMYLSEEKCAHY